MAQALELVCVLLLQGSAQAQIPIQCANDVNLDSGECCPVFWGDGSPCGKDSGRGTCQQVVDERAEAGTVDFRVRWPSYFFHRLCVCKGNYGGPDCGECQYGWQGKGCQKSRVVVRRDLADMNAAERQRFVNALHKSKVTLSKRYSIYVSESSVPNSRRSFQRATAFNVANWVHYLTSKTLNQANQLHFAHRSTAFPVWHRLFLLFLESEIRNVTEDDTFFIPVWSWAGKSNCDVCTDDLFGNSGSDGGLTGSIFRSWEVCIRP
ncbi:tyrosinase-like [Scyliorhinus canicula]|uniref:tyrosinase-like n=1 Tax=Scyliorhinus canicula TaxID=7830 RepID=UPI0018F48B84|nr:tyrosinase-like [Scyliorhinus canicula]